MYIKGEKECRGDKERERERERESGFLMKKERKVELANTKAFEKFKAYACLYVKIIHIYSWSNGLLII